MVAVLAFLVSDCLYGQLLLLGLLGWLWLSLVALSGCFKTTGQGLASRLVGPCFVGFVTAFIMPWLLGMARPDPGLMLDAVLRTFSTIGQQLSRNIG